LYNNTFRNLLDSASKELAVSDNDIYSHDVSFSTTRGGNKSLSPTRAHRQDKIEVRESQSAGVFLAGPNIRIPVTSAKEAFQLINKGNKHRAVGSTLCNDVSSR
jgi:hypothetical protein